MTENTELAAAGWMDDPEDAGQLRYWDGSAWTEHRSPKAGVASADAAQPAAAGVMAAGVVAPKQSGAPWWLVAVTGVVALLIGGGIGTGVGAAVFGGDDAVAAPATGSDKPSTSDETADDAATGDEADADADAGSGGGSGTVADPFAIDTPWTYDTSWVDEDGTQWEGTFEGLVPLGIDEYDEDTDARCFALVGTMSPTVIAGDALVNDFFDAPTFEFIVDGAVSDDWGFCDYASLEEDGYGALYDAEVSVGTEYKFYQDVYLPSSVTGDIELVVLGYASDEDAVYFQATSASVG